MPAESSPGPHKLSPLVWVCATLLAVLGPLTVPKPGLPGNLKADEPTYYLMALSIWNDRDLICENRDIERLFREFPTRADNLLVMSADGWKTIYYSAPFIYSMIAAPFVGIFGANGMISLNIALTLMMIALGIAYLRRHNSEPLAVLFALGFFILSCSTVYNFWLQPEIFYMTCVMASLYLIWPHPESTSLDRPSPQIPILGTALPKTVGSAVILSFAGFSRPMLASLALPIMFQLIRHRGWKMAVTWCLATIITLSTLGTLSYTLTEHFWPYYSFSRRAVSASSPIDFIDRKVAHKTFPLPVRVERTAPQTVLHELSPFDPRRIDYSILTQNLEYFFVGRHVGLLIYLPFATICVTLFLVHHWRSPTRWFLVIAIGIYALSFLLIIPDRWQGGGGFIGNRYFVIIYPAFLFLITQIKPLWLTAAGYGFAGIFLWPLLLTPYGASATPSLQIHARSAPHRLFPTELTLARKIPGHHGEWRAGAWIRARRDVFRFHGEEMWFHGATPVEAWLQTEEPLESVVVTVRSPAPNNEVGICLEGSCRELRFESPNEPSQRLQLSPGGAWKVAKNLDGQKIFHYRLRVKASTGEKPRWRGTAANDFYLGAAITFLGTSADLERDMFHVTWDRVTLPKSIAAGDDFKIEVKMRNSSAETWPALGSTAVKLSYHWLSESEETLIWEGERTPLPADLRAGEELRISQHVRAPGGAGSYILIQDLVREQVSWFSEINPHAARRTRTTIQPQMLSRASP